MSEARTPVGAIFDAAIELPPERRAAYLLRVCGGDDGLRRRVEALLRAHESSGEFMDSPAVSVREGSAGATLAEGPGDRIGRYKLLQQIGEGGCGVVYMAEQEEPVRRRVALKVIKLGMDTKSVITRFEAERQALALMEHPNIAKVFDAGATETGRPYFVMELVRGVKVTDYCDQNNLSTRERLDLFIRICRAIQHAHQKGIIHRDIKPSNILVTVNDGVPVPKVIDFGIAKATQGRLTDDTLFTAFEQFLGTPAYMSPEQAVMTSLDIDTRSDIYSLGVLLYELLSGKTPFGAEELLAAGLDELRRTIREKEPVRPSTRLSTMLEGELKRVARQRQTEPPKLIHLLRGDLDWIVMKALEKDRNRRYPTANNLAADVKRHLLNEPVLARPPSALYRVQKLIVRNRLATLAALAILFSLIACLIISTLFYFKERRVLYASYLAEARALRMGGHVGQRFESLKAVEKAGAIRKGPEVRDEAIASLARTDLRWAREKTLGVTISGRLAHFDVPFQCYDVANDNGGVAVRRVADDQQIAELSAPGFKPVDLRGFTSDSRYLKIRSRDANSGESDWVWDIKSQKVVLRALPGSLADVFSPDGRLLDLPL
ncbi:MAG TPA: serine/threonine-protein kinase, partial [Candidatus Saccharimonadales bacterium]|nr:serine/threonine-protein kinase [Candidatus Saccharimonadales bacterium]